MDTNDLNTLLHRGLVRVTFTKKSDKSRREMRCTCHPAIMPPPPPPKLDAQGFPVPKRPMPEGHLLVWDVEAGALRSFDTSTLLEEPVLLEDLGDGA